MNLFQTLMTIVVATICAGYDFWLIIDGQFNPFTILPLVGWMALVVWFCRDRASAGHRGSVGRSVRS